MKKCFYVPAWVYGVLMFGFIVSCNKTISYEEKKSAERRIINRMIAEKNIEILTEFPKDSVFGENQFVQLKSGIYLNIVDSGNGNRAESGKTLLLVRTSGEYYTSEGTTSFNTFENSLPPFEFIYGNANLVVYNHASNLDMYYFFFSAGLELILDYVGENAIVKLIVPGSSEISVEGNTLSTGSAFQQSGDASSFIPIYYDKVRYLFY